MEQVLTTITSNFPQITPFHAEMRRRVWATVVFGDCMLSSQMGMPRMISEGQRRARHAVAERLRLRGHVIKSDGTEVHVLVSASFQVTEARAATVGGASVRSRARCSA